MVLFYGYKFNIKKWYEKDFKIIYSYGSFYAYKFLIMGMQRKCVSFYSYFFFIFTNFRIWVYS